MQRRLYHATLPYGYMWPLARSFPDSPTIVALNGKHVVGWALVSCCENNDDRLLNIFVNERYRRHRLAERLVGEALKDFPCVALAAWNPKTRKLFKRLQRENPGRVMALPWRTRIVEDKYRDILLAAGGRVPA